MDKKKNMGIEHRKALCFGDRAVLDCSRVWKEATIKTGLVRELNTVVVGLKDKILSLMETRNEFDCIIMR